MAKKEWDGLPQYRILQAISDLIKLKHQRAISLRIAPIVGRSIHDVGALLLYYWDKGLLKRMSMRKRRARLPEGQYHKKTFGCQYHYDLTKKGEARLEKLRALFGRLDRYNLQQPQSCLTLPSDTTPQGASEQAQTPTPSTTKTNPVYTG